VVCPSHISLVHYYRFAKNQVWAQEQERRKADRAKERHQSKQARLERQEAERKARLRKKKEDLEPGAAPATPQGAAAEDPKRAAIEAARARAAAKKAAAKPAAPEPNPTPSSTPAPAPASSLDQADRQAEVADEGAPGDDHPRSIEETAS
jgi:Na+-translocating ferredoxin:NAD+ oxidoreductase RnfC subunit